MYKKKNLWGGKMIDEKEYYKGRIIDMLGKVKDPKIFKQTYKFLEYLYLWKDESGN